MPKTKATRFPRNKKRLIARRDGIWKEYARTVNSEPNYAEFPEKNSPRARALLAQGEAYYHEGLARNLPGVRKLPEPPKTKGSFRVKGPATGRTALGRSHRRKAASLPRRLFKAKKKK